MHIKIIGKDLTGFHTRIITEDGKPIPFVTGCDISIRADGLNTATLEIIPGELDILAIPDWEDYIEKLFEQLPKDKAKSLALMLNHRYC